MQKGRAREQRGASTANVPEETYGHINNAFCDGMTTTVTAAHHFIWRHLYYDASMQAAQSSRSKLRIVTPDKESTMNTLESRNAAEICWRKRQQKLTKRSLWKSTDGNAMTSTRLCFMKIVFGIGGQMAWWLTRIIELCILEFKRSSDRDEDFLRVK